MSSRDASWILAVDTAGARAVVVADGPSGRAVRRSDADRPHGGALLALVDAALAAAGLTPGTIGALGVVTGPGSFTGLRVGLAFVKTLAWSDRIPLVGIDAAAVARRAVAATLGADAYAAAVVRPAGARDHYCSFPGPAPFIVPPGADPTAAVAGRPVIALGGAISDAGPALGLGGRTPAALGRLAEDGAGDALLALVRERLAAGPPDDPALLEPVYVAPPRGVTVPADRWAPSL